jgi:hypothetical protein
LIYELHKRAATIPMCRHSMETKRSAQIVSIAEARTRQEASKQGVIAGVQQEAGNLLGAARKRLEELSEDAYASRNEIYEDISFLTWFAGKVARARPGASVNLGRTVTDYGYDPEDEASQRSSGLPYTPEADQEEADYHRRIGALSPLLRRLDGAGVRVKTGIKRVFPKDEFEEE